MGFNVEAVVADPAVIDAVIKKHFSKSGVGRDVVSTWRSTKSSRGWAGKGDQSIDLDAVMEAARTTR
jgi:hypothetical protein